MVLVPYGAWGAELSGDYGERTRLFAARQAFVLIGLIAAALIPAIVERSMADNASALVVLESYSWLVLITLLSIAALLLWRVPEPAQAEVARTLGTLIQSGAISPARTISMVWGDEITSTRRYVEEDADRASGILWGVSLDMVGQDTDKTGGTFLIEKMPDPSAIWTRGEDQHTDWWNDGRGRLSQDDLTPHYFNDFILGRCLDQAAVTDWVVKTNPFEGGSDHVPFLRGDIPGLLLWHFTDMFYHTDGDRLDKVSAQSMMNVGVATTVSALTLASADGQMARFIIAELEAAALDRLAIESELSREAVAQGEDVIEQTVILKAWVDWYVGAIQTTHDIEVGGASPETIAAMEAALARVSEAGNEYLNLLQ